MQNVKYAMLAGKMWCYCRTVYMPSSYLYGKRFVGAITPLVLQLREELHTQPYHEINWNRARHLCAKVFLILQTDSLQYIYIFLFSCHLHVH